MHTLASTYRCKVPGVGENIATSAPVLFVTAQTKNSLQIPCIHILNAITTNCLAVMAAYNAIQYTTLSSYSPLPPAIFSIYRCTIFKKAFNVKGSTTAFLVLKVVLPAVVVISEVFCLSTKSRCSRCCMAHLYLHPMQIHTPTQSH